MRVTNSIVTRNSQLRLQAGLAGVDRLREDISSGIRIRRMSDDPTSASEVVRVGSSMRAITQFNRNINIGLSRASAEENVLDQLSKTLSRAAELGTAATNGTASSESRLAIKKEVDQLLDFSARLGNTRFGDEYLFGGTRAGEAPFTTPPPATGSFSALTLNGSPVDPSGNPTLEIGDNKFITPIHNGTEVFLDTDALEALRSLSTALGANDTDAIRRATDRITASDGKVQALVGTQGARINEMESARTTLKELELSLTVFRSDLRDTVVDQTMAELVGKQTLYQAAMSVTSRVLGLSLANYI